MRCEAFEAVRCALCAAVPAEESATARHGCAPPAPDRATSVERTAGGLHVVLRRLRRAARALGNSHSKSHTYDSHVIHIPFEFELSAQTERRRPILSTIRAAPSPKHAAVLI